MTTTATPDLLARHKRAIAYVDSLRNPAKRAYAERYMLQVVRNGLPEPDRGSLSYMGAQAVALRLGAIMRGDA
jgi:hypothetical protein